MWDSTSEKQTAYFHNTNTGFLFSIIELNIDHNITHNTTYFMDEYRNMASVLSFEKN